MNIKHTCHGECYDGWTTNVTNVIACGVLESKRGIFIHFPRLCVRACAQALLSR